MIPRIRVDRSHFPTGLGRLCFSREVTILRPNMSGAAVLWSWVKVWWCFLHGYAV